MPTVDINLGITLGTGQEDYLTKIITVSGSDIVTIGNSFLYENGAGLWGDIGFSDGLGTQLFLGYSGSGIATIDGTNYGAIDVGSETVNLQTVTGGTNVISRLQVNNNDILVKSPNISDATYAYFETDGMGNFTMRGVTLPSGGGTVTDVSVVSANGFAGTVANSTTTPAITLTTSITGLIKGNGTAISAASDSDITSSLITGVSISGGSIAGTDTMLAAFGKLQNQINGVLGGAVYQGVWNASTNSPTLTSSTGTKGYYYVVSVAGSTNLDGITDWKVGDWAIFNGATWDKVDNTDAVSSVNGLTGAVALTGTSNRITISGANVFDIGTDVVTLTGSQALTNKTYNGNTFTAGTGTLTIAASKTATFSNTITFAGTDSTTITMPTATSTVLANNLGLSGGTTLIGGTAATDKIIIQATSNSTHTAAKDLITLRKNSAAAAATSVLMTIGDGQGLNNDEVSIYSGVNTGTNGYLLRAGATFAYFNASSSLRLQIGASDIIQLSSTTATMVQGVTISDAKNIVLNTTTGTKIGTATSQKLGFWNVTPIIQPASANQAAVATTGATNVTPYGFTTAAQADAIVTLVNQLRSDLVAAGIIKGAA